MQAIHFASPRASKLYLTGDLPFIYASMAAVVVKLNIFGYSPTWSKTTDDLAPCVQPVQYDPTDTTGRDAAKAAPMAHDIHKIEILISISIVVQK
jgi:hypothetical protein